MSDEKPQDNRLLDIGDEFKKDGHTFEVVTVSAQEGEDGEMVNFRYELASKEDMDKLRALNEEQLQ